MTPTEREGWFTYIPVQYEQPYFIPYTFFFLLSIVSFNRSRSVDGGFTSMSFFSSLAGGLRFRVSHTLSYTSDIVHSPFFLLSGTFIDFILNKMRGYKYLCLLTSDYTVFQYADVLYFYFDLIPDR